MTVLNMAFAQVTADIVRRSGTQAGTIEDIFLGNQPGPFREVRLTVAIGNPVTDRYEVTVVLRDAAFEDTDLFGKLRNPETSPV